MVENGSKKKNRYWKNKLYNYYWRIAKSFIPFVFDSGCGNLGSRLATVTNVTLTEAKMLNKTSVENWNTFSRNHLDFQISAFTHAILAIF